MAARRCWVVFVDDQQKLHSSETIERMQFPYEHEKEILSVFYREDYANAAAKILATKYPGKDVHVFKQTHGYTSQPKPVEYKEWTPEGHFIPLTK